MTDNDFVYWLQGFFELSESKELTEKQVQIIKDHLSLVFKKVTPKYDYKPLRVPQTTLLLSDARWLKQETQLPSDFFLHDPPASC